jgi:sugar (pentulose or hexulose) kinase
MRGTVLGVDVGTSGCRAAAYDTDLAEVAAATARYPITAPAPDRAEIDADEVWAAVAGCMRKVNAQLAEGPMAVAVTVQGETVVPVGADGAVLAMAPIAVDMRAVAETASICRAVGADRIRAITGQPPHPMFSVGKIAWLRREPQVWQCTAGVHCLGDLIARRLGVEPAIDYTMAARTMAFDGRQGAWSAEILEAAGIPARWMPPAVPVGTELGWMPRDIAWDLGFAHPPLVVAGAHDQACALWGAGATEPGQAALSLGTSECLTLTVPGWPAGLAASSFPMYRPCASDDWIVLAGIPSGGASLDWLAGLLAPAAAGDPLSQLVSSIPAEPARVLALPHFGGSGTAENDPLSRGAFIGLSHGTSRGELLRALLEASGFEAARSVHALALAGIRITELRVSGGGTASGRTDQAGSAEQPGPIQVRASAAGLPLGVVRGHATARGAAMVAGGAIGLYPALSALGASIGPPTWVRPDPGTERWYEQQRQRYALLYPALRPVYHFTLGDNA